MGKPTPIDIANHLTTLLKSGSSNGREDIRKWLLKNNMASRAVNAYEDLLDCAKEARHLLSKLPVEYQPITNKLDHAIAKAKGGN